MVLCLESSVHKNNFNFAANFEPTMMMWCADKGDGEEVQGWKNAVCFIQWGLSDAISDAWSSFSFIIFRESGYKWRASHFQFSMSMYSTLSICSCIRLLHFFCMLLVCICIAGGYCSSLKEKRARSGETICVICVTFSNDRSCHEVIRLISIDYIQSMFLCTRKWCISFLFCRHWDRRHMLSQHCR